MARRQVRLWTDLPPLRAGGMLSCVLPFHYHRHCTHVSFTAVLRVDVLQHCVSSKRSSVSNVSVDVLSAHLVKTGTTDEGQTVLLSNDTVHIKRVQNVFRCPCDQHHLLVNGDSL